MRKLAAFLALACCMVGTLHAQRINNLFQARSALSRSFTSVARQYQALTINSGRLSALKSAAPDVMDLELPFENHGMVLNLRKVRITSPDFRVTEVHPDGSRHPVSYNDGVFYQGKIAGDNSSFATVSLVGGQVMAIIADAGGNIVLGSIEESGRATEEYTMYRERDLIVQNNASCATGETPVTPTPSVTTPVARGNQTGQPIDIYFECDYKMYQQRSSNTNNTINFVLGFFNNTALLYANEDIKVQVSEILVWTTQDPEAANGLNTTNAVLNSFSDRMSTSSYHGDFAHFLSMRSLGGGVAWLLSNSCAVTRYYRCGVSAIDNGYNNVPTYSWTVEVVTHELGHNFGSNHTQWCGWVGGAIDNCYPTEPYPSGAAACPGGPTPTNGGTIMSYCHLSSVGINLANGFGTQPGDKIRATIGASNSCIGVCKMTIVINKFDASCGQANGSATAVATDNTGALTYLWSNGQTGQTLTGVLPGTYYVTVSDAAGCQVMEDVVIGNAGTTLTFSLTPSGTAGFCIGGNLPLNATNNPAYTYVWTLNSATIPGATTSTYTASTAGTYAVTATSGACSGTQSVVVSALAPPTANITASGPTTFCDGSQVTLNANIGSSYSYQWYKDGTAITTATSGTYIATTSGAYTVKVSAGAACSATSTATNVSATPSPVATITTSGNTGFCDGLNVVISTTQNAAYAYQWYRNSVAITGATTATYTATTSGTYYVTASQGTCTTTSASTTVTVFPLPVVTVTPATSTIEKFETQTLSFSGAATYNLVTQPAFLSSTVNTLTIRPLTTTVYTVIGTTANGCMDTVMATINVVGCGTVTGFADSSLSPSRTLLKWTNPTGVTTDSVQYRVVGSTTWTRVYAPGNQVELTGLLPDTDYEYNVIPICSTTSTYIPSADQAFKTAALQGGLYVRLFPNPVVNTSRLEVISSGEFELNASIYDNAGKLVMQLIPTGTFPAGQVIRSIDGSRLSAGVYHISIYVNGKLQNVKMLVIR